MGRIDGQRSKDRPDLRIIITLHAIQLLGRQVMEIQETDAAPGQFRAQLLAPAAILVLDHFIDALPDGAKRFARCQAVEAPFGNFRFDLLLDAGHADLEEFIEVGAGNTQEFKLFQQRIAGVECLIEDPLVEFQPAQFAVKKVLSPAGHGSFCSALP